MIAKKETQGIYSYLVFEIEDADELDEFSLGMLSNNDIEGLIPLVFTQMDDKKYLKYNISSRVPASEFFAGIVNKKRLIGVLESIVDALISSDEYMLDSESMLLDLDYIYVDVSTNKAKLVYLPVSNDIEKNQDVSMFFKEIMFSNQFDQTENCDYVAKLMNFLNSSSSFNVYNFKQLLSDIQLESVSTQSSKKQNINVQKQNSNISSQTQKAEPIVNRTDVNSVQQPKVNSIQKEPVVRQNIPDNRISVPPVQPPVSAMNVPQGATNVGKKGKDEKEISMFHLLMHYSKENKEKYRQQKQEKNSGTKKSNNVNKKDKNNTQAPFSVPGANFSVPGLETPKMQDSVAPQSPVENKNSYVQSVQNAQQNVIMQPRKSYADVAADFGETTILGGGADFGGTTVLSEQETPIKPTHIIPYLIRLKNNERILINKPRYRLGKEKSYVDYFIGDNAAVSRSHADIVTNGEEYSIIDMNSTNHTYVNNQMIQSGVEVKLNDGDKVKLGNEEFEFKER